MRWWWLFSVLASCTQGDGSNSGEPIPGTQGCVSFDAPEALTAEASKERVSTQVTLRNPCAAPIDVPGLRLEDPAGVFSVGSPEQLRLAPGESTVVSVDFEPRKRGLFAALLWFINPDGSVSEVEVEAVSTGPQLVVPWTRVTVEGVPLGCPSPLTLNLMNEGEHPGAIVELVLDGDDGWLVVEPTELPLEVLPGQTHTLTVSVTPTTLEPIGANLGIVPEHPSEADLVVRLQAEPRRGRTATDTFQWRAKRDVLVALDRSASMPENDWAAGLSSIVQAGRDLGTEPRVAVVVGDAGCVVGPNEYVDASFSESDAEAAFDVMVDLDFTLARYGSNTERPLARHQAAVAPRATQPGGCNAAFFRDDAELHLVSISQGPALGSVDEYVKLFRDFRPLPAVLRHHYVADQYGDCSGRPGNDDLIGLTEALGGVGASLCDPFDRAMRRVGEAASAGGKAWEGGVFALQKPALAATVQVRVDDAIIDTGWAFDTESNAVVFAESARPGRLETVTVDYVPTPDCSAR